MNRRRFVTTSLRAASLAVGTSAFICRGAEKAAASDAVTGSPEDALAGAALGPWRRLFLDASAVEEQQGLTREFHSLRRHPSSPVVRQDQPWESGRAISGPYVYGTVMRDAQRFRLWYQLIQQGNHIGYAESTDGLHWTKPALGLIQISGSRQNNLVVSTADLDVTGGECHNPSVIFRPAEKNPAERFLLFGFDGKRGHPRVAFSGDGLRWRYPAASAEQGLFSSSDVVNFFWDPYQARYAATWKTKNRRGRAVGVAWSKDAVTWTKPLDGAVFGADDLDPDATQIYGMPAFPYQGLYVGMPWIYHARYFKDGPYSVEKLHEAQQDSSRHMDVQLAWSWDLINWTRPPQRAPLLNCGKAGAFDSGMVFTARAPVVVGDELWFYYGGADAVHDEKRVHAAIGLATLRLDGFCSLRAGSEEGSFISRRESLREPAVTINARTAPNGSVTVEILNRQNQVVPGFSRAECQSFKGDAVRHALKWNSTRLPAGISEIKFRFWLRDADLFSYVPGDVSA